MNAPTTIRRQRRRLCDAIGEAVSVTWADVMPKSDEGLMHVEYEPGAEHPIEWMKVWSSTRRGHWSLVCEYWMDEHPFGKIGLQFAAGYHSDGLGQALDLIMQHQRQFAPPENGLLKLIQLCPRSAPNAKGCYDNYGNKDYDCQRDDSRNPVQYFARKRQHYSLRDHLLNHASCA